MMLKPQAVLNTLSIGASLLLPPLRERTELLLSLLPHGPQSLNVLSKGQVCFFFLNKVASVFVCYWVFLLVLLNSLPVKNVFSLP